jgi:hypothetical protein
MTPPVHIEQAMTAKLDSNRPVGDMVLASDISDGAPLLDATNRAVAAKWTEILDFRGRSRF